MGKFDDWKKDDDLQMEEDVYGSCGEDAYGETKQLARLNQKVQVQQKVQSNKEPEYVKNVEIEKTMELMFIDGILHQKVIESYYTLEVNSGESVLNNKISKWEKIPSTVTKDVTIA